MICNFSKVAFDVFGFQVHWYSLAYIFGILFSVYATNFLAKRSYSGLGKDTIDAFISYAIVGIILGGRLGHVLFYDFEHYCNYPSEIIKIWNGGMSFYGGFLGTIGAAYFFCRRHNLIFLKFMDLWAVSVPVGLFLGRIANFINGELVGKESDVPWAVVFLNDGVPRHPSQIYESILEGIVLFALMVLMFSLKYHRRSGVLCGIFCSGYAAARVICEFFREPDSYFSQQLFLKIGINLNQCLSIVLVFLGIFLICRRKNSHESL
ncbi:MAG: prolipoprotein diacylglyceryl transferase [Holosporaceae bacterium]|nr:prolipoprotein diacylglyceryl transferase [Holosporaceae bacterium]